MNERQMESLMENAQKTFVAELKARIAEIEGILGDSNHNSSENDLINILLRFFHTINGTASTLGFRHIASIGKKWEMIIDDIINCGLNLDSETLKKLSSDIRALDRKFYLTDEEGCNESIFSQEDLFQNMAYRGRILLIDDDVTVLKLLENAFTVEGYKVYICDDSSSAMDIVAAVKPDIIILDIMMPKVNGYELLEEMKSKPEYSEIYVIFLSAKGNTEDRIKGLKFGADDYIAKPFIIREVITKVEIMMRRSANYKEKLLKDSLTDAYSRYYLNFRLAEELERYKRSKTVFSAAFVDLDNFKSINDQYGHLAGDQVLKELTAFAQKSLRKYDSIYRYGGEEFIVLMPDTSKEDAFAIMDRLRESLDREKIRVGGSLLNITFSAGIKQVNEMCENVDEIIGHADKAMYHAKKCGRNRVVIYNDEIDIHDSKKTLLLVDDENTILKLLRDRLSDIGYNVVTAKDGSSALTAAREIRPDAIVLDLLLPDLDGFEVCRQIKENTCTSSTKIIMLSKAREKDNIQKGLLCGADDYVTKPFSMSELEARIMKVLNSSG